MSIKIENINYIYEKGTAHEMYALKNINLTILDGQFIGLIGHTGSGKSTLIQHINGLLKPTSGKIIIDGIDITEPGIKLIDVRIYMMKIFLLRN